MSLFRASGLYMPSAIRASREGVSAASFYTFNQPLMRPRRSSIAYSYNLPQTAMSKKFQLLLLFIFICHAGFAQDIVSIDNYSVNALGQVQLSIQGESDKYYILEAQHSPTFAWETSMTMGVDGTMSISEPGAAYPLDQYTVREYDASNPLDIDGDLLDDVTEFQNMPTDAPLNYAPSGFTWPRDAALSGRKGDFPDCATRRGLCFAPRGWHPNPCCEAELTDSGRCQLCTPAVRQRRLRPTVPLFSLVVALI